MPNLAVIPARGGSKRIPRKNIRKFNGRPVIQYAIETALATKEFEKVIVSTDDADIAQIALNAGASVPFIRDSKLSDDFSTTVEVISDAIRNELNAGNVYENACCIYPVTPFLTPNRVLEALNILELTDCDYVFPAIEFKSAIQRAFKEDSNGFINMASPENSQTRTQDLETYFHDAGQFYWGKSETWLENKNLIGPMSQIVKLAKYEAIDIDSLEDWLFAEEIFKIRK